jgi:hypothetical protein
MNHVPSSRVSRSSAVVQAWLLCLCLIVLALATPAQAREKLDFSHHDSPLYAQVVGRIKAKISARLGKGPFTRDRYFIVPFAYENDGNDPEYSHSFITIIRVFAHGQQSRRAAEFHTGTYRGWNFEAYNISWLPADFLENPNLCVFRGFGARAVAKWNQCPVSPGKNFNLQNTLQLCANAKLSLGMWGPYEVKKEAYDLGLKRKHLLDEGKIKYRADDRLQRMDRTAINCFHAIANIDDPFPNGGAFGSGFKMWGLNGTSRVLIEYTSRANRRGLLLDPVDYKKDRYGFVYASEETERGVYNPFQQASAYRK